SSPERQSDPAKMCPETERGTVSRREVEMRAVRKWSPNIAVCMVLMLPLCYSLAQEVLANTESRVTDCILDSGKQISAHYIPTEAGVGSNPSPGKVWTPGGSAMTLFTETNLKIGGTVLRTGAYTMYLIPGKKSWTLIVSRNQKIDAQYDEHEDLV